VRFRTVGERCDLRGIRIVVVTLILRLAIPFVALGQVHEKFEGWCDGLQNASSPDLVQFLNAVAPDEKNARCITWTIHRLGNEHHEPAIPALVKLLDFRLPRTPVEEIFHGLSEESFPAEAALELIGKKVLPKVLRAIEADSTSATARENALSVWMEIYRESDEQPKGVGLLKLEETKTKDGAIKQRLSWALQKALTHCNPPEKSACEEAARTGNSEQAPRGQ
jgi:hypothetical protein